ncbi:MAG TPA: TetR/AcrR family transcriptional regulator [Clostridia bacterium]|nr:TetR/AcrR family transcriptional regulator [Clostridia bacterium]
MDSPEEKIIAATIGCIEKYGIDKTTIRQIGSEAGMNSASINYYFRSKDVLMQRVMEVIMHNAFDIENFKDSEKLPARERLVCVLDGMTAGALNFPNITKAFFSDLLTKDDPEAPIVKRFNEFIGILENELEEAYPEKKADDIRRILVQACSATFLFPGMFPNFFAVYPEIDFSDLASRKTYVESLVNRLLPD